MTEFLRTLSAHLNNKYLAKITLTCIIYHVSQYLRPLLPPLVKEEEVKRRSNLKRHLIIGIILNIFSIVTIKITSKMQFKPPEFLPALFLIIPIL